MQVPVENLGPALLLMIRINPSACEARAMRIRAGCACHAGDASHASMIWADRIPNPCNSTKGLAKIRLKPQPFPKTAQLHINNRSDKPALALLDASMRGKLGTLAFACTSWQRSPNRTRGHKGWMLVLPVDPDIKHIVGSW